MNDKEKLKNLDQRDQFCCGKKTPCCDTSEFDQEILDETQNAALPNDMHALQNELETCRLEVSACQEKFTLLNADFQNYRKRMEKEQIGWMRSAQADVLSELLSIVDDFERAFEKREINDESTDAESWISGFIMIHKSLQKILEKFGVKPMDNYDVFDPNFHEALMQTDSADHESGAVVQVLQKGYLINGEVLRPAKVSVAQ